MTRILIVEDEESFSDPLSYSLRKEGYEVAVADNGTDGLRIFSAHGADLVLLDNMPLDDLRTSVALCREAGVLTEASGGVFPYFTYASTLVELEQPLGARRVRAVPDGRHAPGIC